MLDVLTLRLRSHYDRHSLSGIVGLVNGNGNFLDGELLLLHSLHSSALLLLIDTNLVIQSC